MSALLHDPAERQVRIEQKKQQLLRWLVDFTWTNSAIAGEVMKLKSRSAIHKTLGQFEKRGLIRSNPISFTVGRDVMIYGITPEGLLWVDQEEDWHYSKPVFDPAKVSLSTFQHRLDVQRCRLQVRKTNGFSWVAENNLPRVIQYHPDAIVSSASLIVALELERTAKTRKRYQQIIVQHLRQISQGHYAQVHYVSTIDGFAERLQRLLFSIPQISVKGQKVLFTDELKAHFKFYSLPNWKLKS